MKNNRNEITSKVYESLDMLQLPIDVTQIKENDDLKNHGIDSIQLMEFMLILEENFSIEFDETLELENLSVISKLSDYIYEGYND